MVEKVQGYDNRSGRSSTSTKKCHVARVNELMLSNRGLTIRKVAGVCNIWFVSRNPNNKTRYVCRLTHEGGSTTTSCVCEE